MALIDDFVGPKRLSHMNVRIYNDSREISAYIILKTKTDDFPHFEIVPPRAFAYVVPKKLAIYIYKEREREREREIIISLP